MDPLAFDAPDGARDDESPTGAGLTNLAGKQIGRYLVGQQLGSGGAATVYRAYDQVQGITVALKLLLPGADEKAYDRFRREATLAGALRHPHIVRILQIGIAPKGEVAYIAMELVEGESLSDLLNQRGRLRPEETANLLEPIARALAFAHRQGVIHRDVKPGNILLRPVSPGASNSVQLESLDNPVVPLLSDFGIARALDAPELTTAGRTVGTPAYMAPEQCAGSRVVDGRADIYALGAVLYRCITGRLPYAGTTTQILHAHVYEPLTIDDSVLRLLPPILVEILQRSMAKRPEDRYADADALADALAIAAGRIAPRPGSTTGETTATLTLAALPVVAPAPAPRPATVLVPGIGEATGGVLVTAEPATRTSPLLRPAPASRTTNTAVAAAGPSTDAAPLLPVGEARTLGTRLERLNWPGIALSAVMGLLAVVLLVSFGIQGPGLLGRLTGGATPTPTAGLVSQLGGTPGLLGGTAITPTASATATPMPVVVPPTATATATATPTAPPPPPTATPLPPPTATPVPSPTATSTLTPMATATTTATATETPAGGPNPTLVVCQDQIDPGLREYLFAQESAMQAAYGCPDAPPLAGTAESLPFEHGYIVGFDTMPEMLVVYNDSKQWQRQFVPTDGADVPVAQSPPAPPLYLPMGRFGWMWTQGARAQELGYALAPEPGAFAAVYQSFPGALMILNRDSGEVVVLPAANYR